MSKADLDATYRNYIACLNKQDWTNLGRFVHDDVRHNGRLLGLDGYRAMLETDYERIPDLRFEIQILIADPQHVACRLRFDVTPQGDFLGLSVNGQSVTFCENVIYAFRDGKIQEVWSVIDKAAIEAQLR
ncbi:ester cyclase [Halotalea alkalilenta]|uniref:Ester cyclase n=1 Tax=Halotalea alkalilenta TaxID=376489 RepID=A0A172YHJ3_9GAMM|nr:ester cyclase [Halotalea alkalilenta]ANF58724.1 ester cyclase [Halotalea alkalilenta]